MTVENSISEASDTRTLLEVGAGSTEATPPPARPEESWEEYAARYMAEHPEISAAVPSWADEVTFSEIDNELEGTIFSFSTSIGCVELYGIGRVAANGVVELHDGGSPNVYLPSEVDHEKVPNVADWLLSMSKDCIAAALLLRAEGCS